MTAFLIVFLIVLTLIMYYLLSRGLYILLAYPKKFELSERGVRRWLNDEDKKYSDPRPPRVLLFIPLVGEVFAVMITIAYLAYGVYKLLVFLSLKLIRVRNKTYSNIEEHLDRVKNEKLIKEAAMASNQDGELSIQDKSGALSLKETI